MKKTIFFSIIFITLIAILFARAQQGNPLQSLTDSVNQLKTSIASLGTKTDDLQTQVNNLNTLIANPTQPIKQYNIFMNIDGIPGESTDDKHKDWIEVLSYSNGMFNTGFDPGGGGAGRVNIQDFSIVKKLDKASPLLYKALATGDHIKEIRIELTKATGDKQKYMEYKMTDILISGIQYSGSTSSGDDRPIESVSFNFGKIEWTYTILDETGKPKGTIKACWDIKANRVC